jgi:hypothetical protein
MSPPDVTVASGTKLDSIIVPGIQDDAKLTLLTAISAFGDSTHPYFMSKIKHSRKQFWTLNSYSRAMIIRLERHRKLLSLKHFLLTGLRQCSLRESMNFVKNLLMKAQ